MHICCYFNKKLSAKNINSTKECLFSGEHPPYNLSREEGASGVDNSTRHHIDVSSPAAGLVLLSTTVFILFLAGGCWTLLCIFRPELIQSLGLFLTGGLTVSEILSIDVTRNWQHFVVTILRISIDDNTHFIANLITS